MSSSEEMQTVAVPSSASGAGALPGTTGPSGQGAGRQHNSPVQGLLGKRGARMHLRGALLLSGRAGQGESYGSFSRWQPPLYSKQAVTGVTAQQGKRHSALHYQVQRL